MSKIWSPSLLATVFLAPVVLAGCASQVIASKPVKSYVVGQTIRAPVGGVFLTDQTGYIRTVRHWVGILHSPDGWRTDNVPSADYVRKELLYSGNSGSTIELGYREFRGGFAAPAFYQNVKYDIGQSKLVTFQNFQIEVQSASNTELVARIVKD